MPRLGAKYTVEGYLDDVAKSSFLTTSENGAVNLRAFVAQMRNDWGIDDFVTLFEQKLLPFGWSYKVAHEKSALGRRTHIQVFLPSVLQMIHLEDDDKSSWSEKTLTAHAWSIKVRQGKAKLDVIPTSLYISEHALRRIYERSGGCLYEEFPQLAARLFQEVLEKTDTLLREFVFVSNGNGKYATAVPTSGGVVVANWGLLNANIKDPNLGMLITIKGKYFSRGVGSFRASEFWNLEKSEELPGIEYVPSTFVRTYYSDENISDNRRNSCVLLEILLDNVDPSKISPSNLLGANKNPCGKRITSSVNELVPQATPGLRMDVLDSLYWLKSDRIGQIFSAPYEKNGSIAKKIVNNFNALDCSD